MSQISGNSLLAFVICPMPTLLNIASENVEAQQVVDWALDRIPN
ncbi:MAG: hypothetical protein V7K55_17080 [Nostoc sp.]